MFKISRFSGVFDDTDDVDVCTDGFFDMYRNGAYTKISVPFYENEPSCE